MINSKRLKIFDTGPQTLTVDLGGDFRIFPIQVLSLRLRRYIIRISRSLSSFKFVLILIGQRGYSL